MRLERRLRATLPTCGALVLLAAGLAAADTLFLRDGRRLEGRLVGVRGDTLEFETRGWRSRLERFDRDEVRRIEFDSENAPGSDEGRDDRGGRPRGLRERTVSVSASSAWTDAGVEVRRGQTVYFSASGKVRWGKDRNDDAGGEHNSPRNPARPIPDRPGAALIGRIDDGDPFFIGNDSGGIRLRDSGRLFLGINDDYLRDNSGAFRVTIYY